jgi:hypothetical protein
VLEAAFVVADGIVYFCTTSDNRVWALDTTTQHMTVLYTRHCSARRRRCASRTT